MRFWPFSKEVIIEEVREERKHVIISSDDSGIKRAELAMLHAGFVINENLYGQLPYIAEVFDAYRDLDRKAANEDEDVTKEKREV